PKSKLEMTVLDLAGGMLLVNGEFKLKKGGSITGPGTIVATKKIKIEKDSTIGVGISFIAGDIDIKERVMTAVGSVNNICFSQKNIHIHKESHIEGSLLSLRDIDLKENTTFIGVVYGADKVHIHKESSIIGSVIAHEINHVHENTMVTYDEAIAAQICTQVFILRPAAAPIALLGQGYTVSRSILAIHSTIVNEVRQDDLALALAESDLRITVKNRSTGHTLLTLSTPAFDSTAGMSYLNFALPNTHTVRAGNVLEITGETASAYIGVQLVHHIVSAEEISSGQIHLPDLIVYQIPVETELLNNYPNPFNPETWIPYRLAKAANVTLAIYDVQGTIVRRIEVGHQPAAAYVSRNKAIYFDGRNNNGERVSSGVYFYRLEAGDYSATRKMVIVK
ncbi:T9SS type A sorting domain-containing protein, partial [Candidatus Poribacteria bacterium]|nr:T9SS type A sorting domain-containing protein [Candidatus Poribacteria bacterium]